MFQPIGFYPVGLNIMPRTIFESIKNLIRGRPVRALSVDEIEGSNWQSTEQGGIGIGGSLPMPR
ncbi:MAG: hypothetical protein WAK17_18205 [Candidatus Nitrosopolaris sp.]